MCVCVCVCVCVCARARECVSVCPWWGMVAAFTLSNEGPEAEVNKPDVYTLHITDADWCCTNKFWGPEAPIFHFSLRGVSVFRTICNSCSSFHPGITTSTTLEAPVFILICVVFQMITTSACYLTLSWMSPQWSRLHLLSVDD